MNRDSIGRFARSRVRRFFKFFMILGRWEVRILGATLFIGALCMLTGQPAEYHFTQTAEAAVEAPTIDPFKNKITALQDQVLEELSLGCESKGAREPDALIIFDSNEKASIGRFQYQIATVQHFVHYFTGEHITRHEAITIAMDKDRATELTRRVLFETELGWENWWICSNRLDIPAKLDMIKKVSVL